MKNVNNYEVQLTNQKSNKITQHETTYDETIKTLKIIGLEQDTDYMYKVRVVSIINDKKAYGEWSTSKFFKTEGINNQQFVLLIFYYLWYIAKIISERVELG